MTAEAITAPLSPKSLINKAVAMAEAEIFTMLLPRRSAPISLSGASASLSTISARLLPRRAISVSLARDEAVKPVSDPEKKADITIRKRIGKAA